MKIITFFLAIIIISCDPKHAKYTPAYTVSITAGVVNPKAEILLGDSVAFYFEVPDTVNVNGSNIKVAAIGNDDGANLGMFTNKINSAVPGGSDVNPASCVRYANPGRIGPSRTLIFSNQNGKLRATFYMIPKEKGVYYFHQAEEGYASINNQGLSVRTSINFGNVNRNHQMLIDSAGMASNFAGFLQDRVNRGMEIYGFRVR